MRRIVGVMAVVIAAYFFRAFLVGFGTAEIGELEGDQITTVLDGQEALLTMPAGDGTPKGLVLFFHGQGGTASNKIEEPWLESLSRSGYAIASGDLHITSWGNEASTNDVRNLIDWAEAETGLEVGLWVSGSMGGAVSLTP